MFAMCTTSVVKNMRVCTFFTTLVQRKVGSVIDGVTQLVFLTVVCKVAKCYSCTQDILDVSTKLLRNCIMTV